MPLEELVCITITDLFRVLKLQELKLNQTSLCVEQGEDPLGAAIRELDIMRIHEQSL